MLLRTDSQGIVTLRLNRPGQFNALSEALLAALQAQIDALAGDASLRCVVLEASGRAFSAGHDLREMRSQPSLDYYRELFRKCGAVMQGLQAPARAGHRQGARHRHRRRLPAGGQLRPGDLRR